MNASSLSWYAILKMTKIELEIIPNPDMYLFFDKGASGGIYYVSDRYSKTNSKCLKSYDPKQELKDIMLLRIIYMVMQCLIFFQQADSNG